MQITDMLYAWPAGLLALLGGKIARMSQGECVQTLDMT